jgi:hypothetical protein
MVDYTTMAMFEYLLKLLTPRDPWGAIIPLIGYYIQNDQKKLAFVRSFAVKTQVFGLEVVVGETGQGKTTNGGNQHLNEFKTIVYLTQHESASSTIDEVKDILYASDEFYDQEVHWPATPASTANVRRAVITLKHRCACPLWVS